MSRLLVDVTNHQATGLSPDGVFANGVTATAVAQFISDYDETARIEDVAAYFRLVVADVAAALEYHAQHLDGLRWSGQDQGS